MTGAFHDTVTVSSTRGLRKRLCGRIRHGFENLPHLPLLLYMSMVRIPRLCEHLRANENNNYTTSGRTPCKHTSPHPPYTFRVGLRVHSNWRPLGTRNTEHCRVHDDYTYTNFVRPYSCNRILVHVPFVA